MKMSTDEGSDSLLQCLLHAIMYGMSMKRSELARHFRIPMWLLNTIIYKQGNEGNTQGLISMVFSISGTYTGSCASK